jgi:hypothetical protein
MEDRALNIAMELRRFEIELYWRRAAYFWTLLAAALAGYFALASGSKEGSHSFLLFAISCIGLVIAIAWFLVNRGSKYWHVTWERRVQKLGGDDIGPMFSNVRGDREWHWWKLWEGYRYSVTKVNQLTSLYFVVIWVGLCAIAFPEIKWPLQSGDYANVFLLVATLLFIVMLLTLGLGGSRLAGTRVAEQGGEGEAKGMSGPSHNKANDGPTTP